jgi:protease-4
MSSSRIKKAFAVIIILVVATFIVSLAIGLMGRSFGEKIGIIEVEGVIADSKDLMEEIVRFKEDDSVAGVILRINSPGGAVAPTQEIFKEIRKLREKKKVFVSMGSVCASGGYYIAAAGEKIFASPATVTGSIGVIMEQVVFEDLLKKLGLQANTIKAGDLKDVGSPFRKMKPEERAYFQKIVDTIHQQFMKDIAQSRKMSPETIKKVSDARIFLGTEAKSLGLVDAMGNLYDTVDDMKRVLGMKTKPVLVYGRKPFSLVRWLMSSLAHDLSLQYFSPPFMYLWKP